jgi:AcrR family transcriptional regulator
MMSAQTAIEPAANVADETAKRLQILSGARQVFLEHGFDAASMNDIVRAAGVSKSTVYAYFPSKEKLFEELISKDRRRQAEQAVVFERLERPIEEVLIDVGLRMARLVCADDSVAYLRMVLAVSAKFPAIGASFYEAGPAYAIARISAYLQSKMDDGTLAKGDATHAATQFTELVQCGLVKPKLFASASLQPRLTVEETVRSGVQLFLRGMAK